ncbi:DUF6977 family protein [Clostridium saccharoperbutylacetonicum]|uniref:DarT1-associated NADAR antitoxin family protein n=1 Tax=Clostridium saccharoperbutylacetonicum TaxID=36745 RepID=UPI0039EB984D
MAVRTVFRANADTLNFVEKIDVDFQWYPGFSVSQKQKSIKSLHENLKKIYKNDNILEISSKGLNELGIKLSAFNLMITTVKNKRTFSVESAFQSSKMFEHGGPYIDLLNVTSREAKKDIRLKSSGKLVGFKFYNQEWPLEPKTLFYDWLYMNALYKQKELSKVILNYDSFTDIEFNPRKSVNCQACSAALFVSLSRRNLIDETMKSVNNYLSVISAANNKINSEEKQINFLNL